MFPERLRWLLDGMAVGASQTFTAVSAPVQHAAIAAFEGGPEIDVYLDNSRRVLSALGRWCARKLRAVGLDCPQPVGGFYLFPDFGHLREPLAAAGITTSGELCERIFQTTGVALLPGEVFGRPKEELTARMAYVDFDGGRALEAVAVIPKEQPLDDIFLKRHCLRVVRAVGAITAWSERLAGSAP